MMIKIKKKNPDQTNKTNETNQNKIIKLRIKNLNLKKELRLSEIMNLIIIQVLLIIALVNFLEEDDYNVSHCLVINKRICYIIFINLLPFNFLI